MKHNQYGICLVAWSKAYYYEDYCSPSVLEVASCCIFGEHDSNHGRAFFGESAESKQWSYTGSVNADQLLFWDQPLQIPPDFPEFTQDRPESPSEEELNSLRKSAKEVREANKAKCEELESQEAAEVELAVSTGRTLYRCNECERTFDGSERVTRIHRECPHCNVEFFAEPGERACPDCNRTFTRRIDEYECCPDCADSGSEPDIVCLVLEGVLSAENEEK